MRGRRPAALIAVGIGLGAAIGAATRNTDAGVALGAAFAVVPSRMGRGREG